MTALPSMKALSTDDAACIRMAEPAALPASPTGRNTRRERR
jgi:hypothetical protein